jgi:hypothetical protein
MLELGTPDDKYDFLDLHIQGWVNATKKTHDKCFPPSTARRLSAELESALEAFDAAAGNVTAPSRKLEEFPLHDPRFQRDDTEPRWESYPPYFDRTAHAYDWYLKANTEVRSPHFHPKNEPCKPI